MLEHTKTMTSIGYIYAFLVTQTSYAASHQEMSQAYV